MALPRYSDSDSDSQPTQPSYHGQRNYQSQLSQHPKYQSNPSPQQQSNNNDNNNNNNNNNNYNNNHPSSHNYNTSHQPHSDQNQNHQNQNHQNQNHQNQNHQNQNHQNQNHQNQNHQNQNHQNQNNQNQNNQNQNNQNDNNERKYQNDARSTVIINDDQNSNTQPSRHYQRQNNQSQQPQPQQRQYTSQHNYDPHDFNDEKSLVLSTVAPPRQQYVIPRRPDFLEDCPLSHAQPIQLTVNAINAKPRIRGILYRYNVRFHANSDDPNDAEIPENNRARRYDIIRNQLFREIRDIYGKFDFDNTILYCDKEIRQQNTFQYVLNNDDEKSSTTYGTIRIQFNERLDFNNTDAIRKLPHEYISQIVHVVHRNLMRKAGYIPFGRSHYIDPDKIHSLNIREYPHLEAMHGFLCTMQYTQNGTIMYLRNKLRLKEKRRISELMDNHWNESQNYQYETEERRTEIFETNCRKELKGRYFITLYARRSIRKIDDINFNKSLDATFNRKRNGPITYRQYYQDVYAQDLRQNFPGLIEVQNRDGSFAHYPPELCYLTGYPAELRSNKKITGIIARNTSIPIQERLNNFENVKKKLNQISELQARNMVSQRNVVGHTRTVEYGEHLLKINGFRIAPSTIIYNSVRANGPVIIKDDVLIRNLKDIRPFSNCGGGNNGQLHVIKWGIAYMVHEPINNNDRPQSDKWCYETLSQAFQRYSNNWFPNNMQNEMELCLDPYPTVIEIRSVRPDNMDLYLRTIVKTLEDAIVTYKLEGIVFILPSICSRDDSRMADIYGTVKALCNVKTGTVTQCIRANTISPANQRNDQKNQRKIENCLHGTFRQFMIKLGVTPWKVVFGNINNQNDNNAQNQNNPKLNYLVDGAIDLHVPTMIIGIDVNHNRRKGVSTVGFISTYDRDFCRVMAQIDTQRMGQEVVGIEKMEMLTENAIRNFQSINAVSPEQIFVYRDGVSLGELDQVSKRELMAIKRAARNVCQTETDIQFMIVQKRVSARFFEWDNHTNSLQGAKPRVIIDSDVVSNEFWDFYLIACGAPRDKVANPVRVIIINDDLKLGDKNSKNDIELFTYALCNLYYGWGGAVKIPHVIKYADKIAELYSATVDYMGLINKTQRHNKPNINTGINLSHHFI